MSDALDTSGWYANFDPDGDTFVIFPDRVVRIGGEHAARAEAEAHARTLGVPDPQLDW